ncbi:MAG: hypothetical protein QXI58_04760 [Candidatus Micrarchaeia archaeon]
MKAKEKFHSFVYRKCDICKRKKISILLYGTYICDDCWRKKLIEMKLNGRWRK